VDRPTIAFDSTALAVEASYRTSLVVLRSLALRDAGPSHANWLEHRLRVGATLTHQERVRLTVSADPVNGLWGYGSAFAREADPPDGSASTVSVGYRGSGDPEDPHSYGLVAGAAPAMLRRAYGELETDIGRFSIGRQAVFEGESIVAASGRERSTRFGQPGPGDAVDRALFVTKPLEGFRDRAERDVSGERGLFAAVFYDRIRDTDPQAFGDNLNGFGIAVRWLAPEPTTRRAIDALATVAHRWDADTDTRVTLLGTRAITSVYNLHAAFELMVESGRAPANRVAPAEAQAVRRVGARGVLRWDEPNWSAYLELDFASGDADPKGGDATQFRFAPDTNVGLLMFERVLAFELARANSAAGSPQTLNDAARFSNAFALFPQLDLALAEELRARAGVLMAWAPARLTDPDRGNAGEPRNYHGGEPAQFYGTELDARLTLTVLEHLYVDLEGAVLLPGAALADSRGNANTSGLVQSTAQFIF
jgi:hypothetical protein